jgi:hypothetical protein
MQQKRKIYSHSLCKSSFSILHKALKINKKKEVIQHKTQVF